MSKHVLRTQWILALLLVVATARAQQPDLLALGKQEFEAAKKEFNLGHYEKALEHFETSYRLTALPELLYNLGVVKRQLFERTRKLEYLEQSIEHHRSYLGNPRSSQDPARRAAIEKELADGEALLVKERAARARGEEALALGEELARSGRLDDARAQLESYLRTPGNERSGLVRAAMLEAAIAVARGQLGPAESAYLRALELDRAVAPPPADEPAQRRRFEAARVQHGELPSLSVSQTPPPAIKAGQPVELTITASYDRLALVRAIRLHYRLGGGRAFSTLPPSPPGRLSLPRAFTLAVPPGSKIEYYGEALDANEAVLEHLGTESLPFSVQVQALRGPSVAKKWWFWTAMAGVAAAAATGIALGVTLSQPPPPVDVGFHNAGLRFK